MSRKNENIKIVVEKILKKNKVARDDDKVLWLEYMNLEHNLEAKLGKKYYAIFVKELEKAPAFDTIRRCRAKMQEYGQYIGKRRIGLLG